MITDSLSGSVSHGSNVCRHSAASGIGAATTRYLRERGGRVIACDLHDADVIANLATSEGRAQLVECVTRLSGR